MNFDNLHCYFQSKKPIDLTNADIWDDTLLIKAYDNALKTSKEEVAKRLANLTNQTDKGSVSESTDNDNDSESKCSESGKTYRVGHHIRAKYEVDGVDYEAKVLEVHDNGDCLIQYIGYNNQQIVPMGDLLPSWGRKARRRQIKQAAEEVSIMDCDDDGEEELHPGDSESSFMKQRRMANPSRKAAQHVPPHNLPFGAGRSMIPPPPPMPPMLNTSGEDSEHLSAMLMAWYMSGYYTGLYQGQKLATTAIKRTNKK